MERIALHDPGEDAAFGKSKTDKNLNIQKYSHSSLYVAHIAAILLKPPWKSPYIVF